MIRHAPSIGLGIGLSLRGSGARFTGLLDSYPGAAAAYSLRALTSNWLAGDVVEVRPSSGWTPASFTANQVTNGELVDYVKRPGNFTNSGFETFANNGTGDGFTAANSILDAFAISSTVSGVATDVVTIEFDLTIVSGSPALSLRLSSGEPVSNLEVYTTSGSKTAVLTATGSFDNFRFSEGDVPSEFTVSNVRVSTNDGFVSTWYDQSGNGNDATQATTTAQPKIVDAGALVTGGLDFDGVDDVLSVVDPFTNSQGLSLFLVANITDGQGESTIVRHGQANPENAWYLQIATDSGNPLGLIRCSDGTITTVSTEKYITSGGVVDNFGSLSLYGVNHSNGVGREILVNGTSLSLSKPFGADQSSTFNSSDVMSIGANSNGLSPVAGVFGELIVYDSDESANRAGIETNINDHYSIY